MFITNEKTNTLEKRLNELVPISRELKFLVGFFYFSGIRGIYSSLKNNPEATLKVLVGLDTDATIPKMVVEVPKNDETMSNERSRSCYLESIKTGMRQKDFDSEECYEQISFFLDLLKEGRLQIKKTLDPNHAKLYIFNFKESYSQLRSQLFISGSSNLTRAGQVGQGELNVEISDFGLTKAAEDHFNKLWETAIKITEHEPTRDRLIKIIAEQTLISRLSPFEAYLLVLKTYLEVLTATNHTVAFSQSLEEKGYREFRYQNDAVAQALDIIEENGGVVIADVTGLGKSVIASRIAHEMRERGIIICPPALIGDEARTVGWKKYCKDFDLLNWDIFSRGNLEGAFECVANDPSIKVVIVDEAHHFRNEGIYSYEQLKAICRGRKVILLTATPFNNTPADLFALLKLFVVPGKSVLTLDEDLEGRFRSYRNLYAKLSYILKYYNSKKPEKRITAENYYQRLFGSLPVDVRLVREETRKLSQRIKDTIRPAVIRRNRLDIKNDPTYAQEVGEMPEVKAPEEIFYELSKEQSHFYDRVIEEYFGEGEDGRFIGAIYTPYRYEKDELRKKRRKEEEEEGENIGDLEREMQDNLKEFMRRLAVKRFESSFAAFRKTMENFVSVGNRVLEFIKKTKGKFILDRRAMEKLLEAEDEKISERLDEYIEKMLVQGEKRYAHIYHINEDFEEPRQFMGDIRKDIDLFTEICEEIDRLHLIENDPKLDALVRKIPEILDKREKRVPDRKIVFFTEYTDTLHYLAERLTLRFGSEILVMPDNLSDRAIKTILENFDASQPNQRNEAKILLASDKMAEGFNLGRAGAIINYDIPWNPTRVIQRVGRINRIGKKLFNHLYIYNFFPTEKGGDVIKLRETAQQKMFMIHNALGEDARIFEPDEEVTPATLFKKIQRNPEEMEEESFLTTARRTYEELKKAHPDVVTKLAEVAPRVKSAKQFEKDNLLVFIRKGYSFFVRGIFDEKKTEELAFPEALPLIACGPEEEPLTFSSAAWERYRYLVERMSDPASVAPRNDISIKAAANLNRILDNLPPGAEEYRSFVAMLLEDIQEYKTLAKHTLQRISRLPHKKPKELTETLKELRVMLGKDYLRTIKESVRKLESEVIIAIENRTQE
ncbi:MAG TPA: helicase-related protein [bacterium]|nr:helicase-related protein [bacterium]